MTVRLLASVACLTLACATAGRDNPATTDGPTSDGSNTDAPPDGNSCIQQPCDILTACGCPGEACDVDPDDLNGTACRPITTPPPAEGGACGGTINCAAGAVCLGNPGSCRNYCDDNSDCGQPRGQCLITVTDGTNPIPGIPKTCTSNCDPTNVALGGCLATQKCSLFILDVGGVDTNIVGCATAGAGVQGANCTTNAMADDAKCAKDHLCVTQGANNTCKKACVVGTACAVGTCTAFTTAFIVGGTNYGFCP